MKAPICLNSKGNEVIARCLQIPTCVNDPTKKPATRNEIEPLSSQRMGHESKHPEITWLEHFEVPSGMGNAGLFQ